VPPVAPERHAVRTPAGAPPMTEPVAGFTFARWTGRPGVDRPEGRGGKGDEAGGMVGDGGRDALATSESCRHQVPGVGLVDGGTGRAHDGPTVLAGDHDRAVGELSGLAVEVGGEEPDRMPAAACPGDLGHDGRYVVGTVVWNTVGVHRSPRRVPARRASTATWSSSR